MSIYSENFYTNVVFKYLDKEDIKKYFSLLLTDAEVRVFEKRYDKDGNVMLSTREIGKLLNLSSARVSSILIQIKSKARLFSKYNKDEVINSIKNGIDISKDDKFKEYYKRFKIDIVPIIKKYNENVVLNPLEKVLLNYYFEIDDCIDNYFLNMRLSDKANIIIDYILKNGNLPSRFSKNDDNTSLRGYYDNLFHCISSIFDKKKNNKLLYPNEKNMFCEYISIKFLLDKNTGLNSIDDNIDTKSIIYDDFSEEILIRDVDSLSNQQHIDIIKDTFGLKNGVFKSCSEIALDYNCSPAYAFKVVDRFKSKIKYLSGLSNIQIISMINDERKKLGKEGIISNKLYLLLDSAEESKNYENDDYYLYLKRSVSKIIKKINNNEQLNAKEKQILFEYEVKEKKISPYEKKGLFIKAIHEHNGCFSKKDRETLSFSDGSKLFTYYYHLRSNVNEYLKKQASGELLLYKEQKCLEDYYDIKVVFDMYSKTSQLINKIDELHRLPRRKTNGVNEALFDDGADQYNYYINLKNTYDSIKKNNKDFISLEDIETLDDYNRIQEAVLKNKDNRVFQLIDLINDTKRVPMSGNNDMKFSDGKSSYAYYAKLRDKYYNILISNRDCDSLNNDDKNAVNMYLLVKKNIDKYSKKKQLIDTIKVIKRIPTGGNNEYTFNDGGKLRRYYYNLSSCVKKLEEKYNDGEILNLHDLELIDDYHEIINVLSFFSKRKEDNISNIKRLCNDNCIDVSLNDNLLRKSFYEVYVKIKYLYDNGIDLVNKEGIVNDIFYMSDYDLINRYNISINELIDEYINGYEDSFGVQYIKKSEKK